MGGATRGSVRARIALTASTGAVTVAVAAGALAGCAPEEAPRPTDAAASPSAPVGGATPATPGATVPALGEPVEATTGLAAPWSVAFLDGTALVSERDSGRILEILPTGATREVGAIPGVVHGGEGGLLGIAVGEGELFAYSTGEDGNRIERYALEGGAGSLSLGPARTVLDGLPAAGIHNGGRIAFGPDGMLYAGVGDAGDRAAAQDPDSLAGKILRMTPQGEVPADNPIAGSLVYSLGHRNVQGLAWAADGSLYATEFGQDTWDELNLIEGGANYGWPVVEGAAGDPEFVDPIAQWSPDAASPSGLAVLDGAAWIANLRGRVLRVVPLADPASETDLFVGGFGRLRDVVVGPDGALWVLTNNTDGRGQPGAGDDRLLRIEVGGAAG